MIFLLHAAKFLPPKASIFYELLKWIKRMIVYETHYRNRIKKAFSLDIIFYNYLKFLIWMLHAHGIEINVTPNFSIKFHELIFAWLCYIKKKLMIVSIINQFEFLRIQ